MVRDGFGEFSSGQFLEDSERFQRAVGHQWLTHRTLAAFDPNAPNPQKAKSSCPYIYIYMYVEVCVYVHVNRYLSI